MKSVNANNKLIEAFFELIQSLKTGEKLKISARLSKSMQIKSREKINSVHLNYGSRDSKQTADELIKELKQAHNFSLQIDWA